MKPVSVFYNRDYSMSLLYHVLCFAALLSSSESLSISSEHQGDVYFALAFP